ncbi:hypothetical protein ACG3SL_10970 [Sphingomonas sp. CJ20]
MARLIFAAAAATLALATPALAAERSFTHEGVTYTYTVTPKGDARVLEGTASQGGRFRFVVRDGWVSGFAGNARVSFRAPKSNTAVIVASR